MDLLNLFVKIAAKDEASNTIGKLSSKLGNGLATAAKIGTAAVSAAAAGITALATQSIKSYADYEQLVGGVDKLYGDASAKLQGYAAEAYKTAGMSANEYMDTATQFSASLINSLGGDVNAAADMTDIAMRAMSDNVNVFGTNMEDVSNAFKGFSKENYSMLDNLKLGYGGTKEEMKRLIDDANEYAKSIGQAGDLSMDSFADVVTAIELVQEKNGIAGTTAKEAASTISGSLGMLKGAWSNLMSGIADDNADFGRLMDNLMESFGAVADNLLPRIATALEGVGKFVSRASETLLPQIVQTITDMLPSILAAATDLVNNLSSSLTVAAPQIAQAIMDMLPDIVSAATGIVNSLISSLVTVIQANAPQLITVAMGAVTSILDTILQQLPTILQLGIDLIVSLASGIAQALPELIPQAVAAIMAIATTLTSPENLNNLIEAALAIVDALAQGLIEALPVLIEAAPQLIMNIVTTLISLLPQIVRTGIQVVVSLAGALIQAIPKLVGAIPQVVTATINAFKNGFRAVVSIGKSIVDGIWEGIRNSWDRFIGNVTSAVGGLVRSVKRMLGIHSPSKVFAGIGGNMAQGLGEGWEDDIGDIKKQINNDLDFDAGTISVGTATSPAASSNAQLLNEVRGLRSAMMSMRIYLDTGVLAGGLAEKIDQKLGNRYIDAQRRQLA